VPVPELLDRLLRVAGPTGGETDAAEVWRQAAQAFAEVEVDALGNSIARVGSSGPLLLLAGHIDEIGLSVTSVDDHGYLAVRSIGGWQAEVAVGQRVTIAGREGPVQGVVQRAAARRDDRDEKPGRARWQDVHVDIGARDRDGAAARVRPGDPAVLAGEPVELAGGRLASRALDNRLGSYVVLEAARRLAEAEALPCRVAALAAVQEETAGYGARGAVYGLAPDVAVVVDVTDATDVPGADARETGERKLGAGPSVTRGPVVTPRVVDALLRTAESAGIGVSFDVPNWITSTDADVIVGARAGIPTALLSIPTRYIHTPSEVCDLADVEAAVALLVAFAARVPGLCA
jgi:endoglucanase